MNQLLLIIFLSAFQVEATAQVKTIRPEQAAALLHKKRIIMLDVRTKEEFKISHLPGAIHIDVLDSAAFVQQLQTLRKSKTYVVYCRSGKRSLKASAYLLENRFKKIRNMEGGILAWKGELIQSTK
jgi:rhodanese-related sulfurtransferase